MTKVFIVMKWESILDPMGMGEAKDSTTIDKVFMDYPRALSYSRQKNFESTGNLGHRREYHVSVWEVQQ